MCRIKKILQEVTCPKITCKYPYPGLKKKKKSNQQVEKGKGEKQL